MSDRQAAERAETAREGAGAMARSEHHIRTGFAEEPAEPTGAGRFPLLALLGGLVMFLAALAVVSKGGVPLESAATVLRPMMLILMVLLGAAPLVVGWLIAALGWGLLGRWLLGDWGLGGGGVGLAMQGAIGAGLMCLVMWLAGWTGAANAASAWAIGAAGWVLAGWQLWQSGAARGFGEQLGWPSPRWPIVLWMPAAGLLLACATLAPGGLWEREQFGYDVRSYHLRLPAEWIERGAVAGLEHNVYSYLPNLMETGFLQVGLWRGSMVDGAYAAQLLHVLMALLAAGLIYRMVAERADRVVGGLAAAVFLAVPWTLVTGSMAYNEQAVVAMGAVALALALRPGIAPPGGAMHVVGPAGEHALREPIDAVRGLHRQSLREGLLIGLACGLAILFKLTAGGMIAVPIALVLMIGIRPEPWTVRGARLVGFGAATAAVFSLWAFRNWGWTGNPTFPMFTEWFGRGHWTRQQAERWDAANMPDVGFLERLAELWWEGQNHIHFGYVVFPAALAAAVLALRNEHARRAAVLLLVMIAAQVVFWVLFVRVNEPGRFLIPVLLPMSVLIGLGVAACPRGAAWRIGSRAAAAVVAAVCLAIGAGLYINERDGGAPVFIDGVETMRSPQTPLPVPTAASVINSLPPGSRIYAEGYATPFYVRRPITYHTVWDQSPLGDPLWLEGPEAAAVWLTDNGYTHMIVDWRMLSIWMSEGNYGYDRRIRMDLLQDLTDRHLLPLRQWRAEGLFLYAVP